MRTRHSPADDHQPAGAVQQEEALAFEELWGRHQLVLQTLARHLTRNEAAADDLLQEACLRAYLGLRRLKNPDLLRSWLFGIVINVSREWARSRENRHFSFDSLAEITGGYQFLEPLHGPQDGYDPAVLLEDKELRQLVLESVLQLPVRLRESALLFYFEGMSIKECAAALRVSVSTLKTRLSRARALVRSRLR